MDLINALVGQAGLSETAAKGVAGGILGQVQSAMGSDDPKQAAALQDAVPELDEWKQADAAAPAEESGGGLLGGLLGGGGAAALAGAVGGAKAKNTLVVVQVLGRFGLDPAKAAVVAPIVLKFLKSRLSAGTLGAAMTAAPFLMQLAGPEGEDEEPTEKAEPAGGLGSMLGGLLG